MSTLQAEIKSAKNEQNKNGSTETPLAELKSVCFSYSRKPVLESVNLTLNRQEFATVVGPNGGGKTTLIRLILGLLRPQSGTVRLFGGSPEKMRYRVGYTPQYTSLDFRFPATVLDVVLMGRLGKNSPPPSDDSYQITQINQNAQNYIEQNQNVPNQSTQNYIEQNQNVPNQNTQNYIEQNLTDRKTNWQNQPRTNCQKESFFSRLFNLKRRRENREAAFEALETLNLAEIAGASFGELSGGQRQRVLIARALCSRPEFLILDEPTNNMDPQSQELLFKQLSELNRKIPILMVSHDLEFVSKYVQSVICVRRTVAVHPTSELTGTMILDMFASDVQIVRHDHCCSELGHTHICNRPNDSPR